MIKIEKEKIIKNLIKYTAKVFIAALALNCVHIKITHVVPEKIHLDHDSDGYHSVKIHHKAGQYDFTVGGR